MTDSPESKQKAFDEILRAAKKGDAQAQFNLGVCYAKGEGVKKTDKQAFRWFKQAAEQEYAWGQLFLGVYYKYGIGVEKNDKQAFRWFKQAAEKGNVEAQLNLGVCYKKGEGVKKNDKQAFRWFEQAAEKGDASAQFNLGVFYEKGQGVAKDYKEAIKWYRKSFNAGTPEEIFCTPLSKIVGIIHGILKDLREPPGNLKNKTHFTSFAVFEKILFADGNSLSDPPADSPPLARLRLHNIDGCNDPMEGRALFDYLKIDKPAHEDSYPLIACFCEGSPENLPMWNAYADNATGVGLTVDSIDLRNKEQKDVAICYMDADSKGQNLPTLYRVLYIPRGKQCKKLEKLSKAIKQTLKDDKALKQHLPLLLIELAHVIKYDDYAYEKEVRLVRFAFKDDINKGVLKVCQESKRVYMNAPAIKYAKIVTAPKVEDREYRYAKYLADFRGIGIKRSCIQYR